MISRYTLRRTGIRCLAAASLLWAAPVSAQSFETVGIRARGMGGAFVAVADDATATWWNPAGIAGTLLVDGVAMWREAEVVPEPDAPAGQGARARRESAAGFAFSFPAAGASYYRVRLTEAGPAATAGTGPGRQDRRIVPAARSLLSHHFGLTLVQSLGDAVVVGATAKLVRGEVSFLSGATGVPDAVLDRAAEAGGPATLRADVDAGVLVRLGRVRFGLSGRNLAAPRFDGPAGMGWRLERRARAGLALTGDADRAGRHPWVVAFDADLTRERGLAGERRAIAAGAEHWWFDRRLGLRGGVSASTAGPARTAASGGASLGVAGGVWLEFEATAGGDEATRGWGLAAHVMF